MSEEINNNNEEVNTEAPKKAIKKKVIVKSKEKIEDRQEYMQLWLYIHTR